MSLPASFTGLTQIVHGVPLPAVYVAIIAAALWIVAERLPVGRNLYVIGANVAPPSSPASTFGAM